MRHGIKNLQLFLEQPVSRVDLTSTGILFQDFGLHTAGLVRGNMLDVASHRVWNDLLQKLRLFPRLCRSYLLVGSSNICPNVTLTFINIALSNG